MILTKYIHNVATQKILGQTMVSQYTVVALMKLRGLMENFNELFVHTMIIQLKVFFPGLPHWGVAYERTLKENALTVYLLLSSLIKIKYVNYLSGNWRVGH